MPIGVIVNALSVAVGGAAGAVVGNRLSADFKAKLDMVLGLCSIGMGVSAIVLMENMPAVVFAIIIGTAFGLAIHLGEVINSLARKMQWLMGGFSKKDARGNVDAEYINTLVTIIVLFCASGTGIYGAIVSGMDGDHSILLAKSILDIFTAMVFACSLGMVVSAIAIPQFLIFLALFFMAGIIYPLTNPTMINDFKACGGFIMLATGFRMIKVRNFPIADMIPALVIVMPFSWLWATYILPLVS